MAKYSSVYKQTGPTRRIVSGENTFEKGMYWSETVVGQGYVHTLLNYEIDALNGALHVSPGYSTKEIATSGFFIDNLVFGDPDAGQAVFVNPRNAFLLRAFEGVDNIIAARTISLENNQSLVEQLQNFGYVPTTAHGYELLIYNPINARLVVTTILELERDKYFEYDGIQLRRISVNPISCGQSKYYGSYITNRSTQYPEFCADTTEIVKMRNEYNHTFGQRLHSPYFMQNIVNSVAYNNLRYLFVQASRLSLGETVIENHLDPAPAFNYIPAYQLTTLRGFTFSIKTTANAAQDLADFPQKYELEFVTAFKTEQRLTLKQLVGNTVPSINKAGFYKQVTWAVNTCNIPIGIYFPFKERNRTNQIMLVDFNYFSYVLVMSTSTDAALQETTPAYLGFNLIGPSRSSLKFEFKLRWGYIEDTRDAYFVPYAYSTIKNNEPLLADTLLPTNEEHSSFQEVAPFKTHLFLSATEREKWITLYSLQGPALFRIHDSAENGTESPGTQRYDFTPQDFTPMITEADLPAYGVTDAGILCKISGQYDDNKFTGYYIVYYPDLVQDRVQSRENRVVSVRSDVDDVLTEFNPMDGASEFNPMNGASKLVDALDGVDYDSTLIRINLSTGALQLPATHQFVLKNIGEAVSPKTALDPDIANENSYLDAASLYYGTPMYIRANSSNVKLIDYGFLSDSSTPSCPISEAYIEQMPIGQHFRCIVYGTAMQVTDTEYDARFGTHPYTKTYFKQDVTSLFLLDYEKTSSGVQFNFEDLLVQPFDSHTVMDSQIINYQNEESNLSYQLSVFNKNLLRPCLALLKPGLAPDSAPEINPILNATEGYYAYRSESGLLQDSALVSLSLDTLRNKTLTEQNASKLLDNSTCLQLLTPKQLTPREAVKWGYNMLAENPYEFECAIVAGAPLQIEGILFTDALGNPLLHAPINTNGLLRIFYSVSEKETKTINGFMQEYPVVPETVYLIVEAKNPVEADWTILKDSRTNPELFENVKKLQPLTIPFTGNADQIVVRTTVYRKLNNSDFDQVLDQDFTSLNFIKETDKAQPELENYQLHTAQGMTFWYGRLVLWGVYSAPTTLFLSEPNDPTYFAYPNDIDIFEEPIIHCSTYSDNLLVFTTTQLWALTLSSDGLSWSKTLLQRNLRLKVEDIPYITTIKNFLFFKSGNQFFMVVPRKGTTVGELSLAPVSNTIKEFLKDPFKNLRTIFDNSYPALAKELPRPFTDYLIKYGVHTEQAKVYIDWWFDLAEWNQQVPDYTDKTIQHLVNPADAPWNASTPKSNQYLLVQLVYDTERYMWLLETHITNTLGVFISDASNTDTVFLNLSYHSPLRHRSSESDYLLFNESTLPATWGININHKAALSDKIIEQLGPVSLKVLEPAYPRVQILDTGYKEVSTPQLKKRFREIQLSIEASADNDEDLKFALATWIDGYSILNNITQEIIETEPTFQKPYKEFKILDVINFETENLLKSNLDTNFTLDKTSFTDTKSVKIRKQLNGKGYLIRTKFTNTTHADYSITNYAFVSHNKNAR